MNLVLCVEEEEEEEGNFQFSLRMINRFEMNLQASLATLLALMR